jgi:ribosome maturation protein Sdo1
MEILNKGEYQVSDLERDAVLENLRKEIAHLIVSMCVNSKDLSCFPLSIILKAMSECKVKLNEKQPAKK